MVRLLLPIILALAGAGAGLGAGMFLKPDPDPAATHSESATHAAATEGLDHPVVAADPHGDTGDGHDAPSAEAGHGNADTEFTKLSNQFVVPVLTGGRVSSMVVLTLSLETTSGMREAVFAQEPRIRDTFLQVLFDHANIGGFDGEFTNSANMDLLRDELRRTGRKLLGEDFVDVLVTDIARQDFG